MGLEWNGAPAIRGTYLSGLGGHGEGGRDSSQRSLNGTQCMLLTADVGPQKREGGRCRMKKEMKLKNIWTLVGH